MADEHTYFVRPVSGVWHVTWNDTLDLIGSYPAQPEAVGVAEMLARHMRTQGKTAGSRCPNPKPAAPTGAARTWAPRRRLKSPSSPSPMGRGRDPTRSVGRVRG